MAKTSVRSKIAERVRERDATTSSGGYEKGGDDTMSMRESAEESQLSAEEDIQDDSSAEEEMSVEEDDGEEGAEQQHVAEQPLDQATLQDMAILERTMRNLAGRYRLIDKIGEGTFSTVYKAEDLQYGSDRRPSPRRSGRARQQDAGPQCSRSRRYVAIKKIYVTSSPARIQNELELLYSLRECRAICPLLNAFRHQDQVIAILPFVPHADFRDYYRTMTVSQIREYLRNLFEALKAVHEHGVLHRDIKPTNFLYRPGHGRGVLVDFGLAEREATNWRSCLCRTSSIEQYAAVSSSVWLAQAEERAKVLKATRGTVPRTGSLTAGGTPSLSAAAAAAAISASVPSYPVQDPRPGRRANRAGTRGFRAPEVMFKCTAQSSAIDIWSVGVILLTILARRFPFFHSADDVDALLELTLIFGRRRMRETALLHGQVFETNIPSYSENGHRFQKIVLWCTDRAGRDEQGNKAARLSDEEEQAVEFLERCMECNPAKRITAAEALHHPFLALPTSPPAGSQETMSGLSD